MGERELVEAALFLAGNGVSVDEIASATGLKPSRVEEALAALTKEYAERGGALEVLHSGGRWAMQVRESVSLPHAEHLRSALPPDLLRTAALIAYHQPVRQSQLVAMVGPRAYGHVTALARMKLIKAASVGHTLELSTTTLFPEFFGLPVDGPEELKRVMAERVLIKGDNRASGAAARPSVNDNLKKPLK